QAMRRRDVGSDTPFHHISYAPLIDLKIRCDPRIVVAEETRQLNDSDHFVGHSSVFHQSPFRGCDRVALDEIPEMNQGDVLYTSSIALGWLKWEARFQPGL